MKAPMLFEETPPTSFGSIAGIGIGLVYVIVEYGFRTPLANAVLIVMTSLGILLVCFWAMRRQLVFWMTACPISIAYMCFASKHLFSVKGDMGYELYPQIVTLSLVQIAVMYIGGIVTRDRQAKG